MNQAIDYGAMAQMLMMNPQMVGDVIPFHRRGINPMNLTEGARPRYGGGPSQWRTPEGVSAYEAQSGLRPGTLAPVNPNRGQVHEMPGRGRTPLEQELQRGEITPQQYKQIMALRQMNQGLENQSRADAAARGRQFDTDINTLSKLWHSNSPNMNKALEKLKPSEANKLFDMLFKAPPGVEFP